MSMTCLHWRMWETVQVCEREKGQVCMCHSVCVHVRGWCQVSIFTFYLVWGRGACLPIHCIGQSIRPSIPRGPPVSASCLSMGALRLETWAENPGFMLVLWINAQIFMFMWQAHYSLNWLPTQYLYFYCSHFIFWKSDNKLFSIDNTVKIGALCLPYNKHLDNQAYSKS